LEISRKAIADLREGRSILLRVPLLVTMADPPFKSVSDGRLNSASTVLPVTVSSRSTDLSRALKNRLLAFDEAA
jgi:hypothetical protein